MKGFPGVIGAIDGTHIKIDAKGVQNREKYRNRENVFTINVQAVCDSELRFINVVARWPGSVYDSRILANSELSAKLVANEIKGWLIGDNGYACKPYLLTPLLNPQSIPQKRYNNSHIATRNVIERAFGVLKTRFGCLDKVLKIQLKNTLTTIIACFVLHNFCLSDSNEYENINSNIQSFNFNTHESDTNSGTAIRNTVIFNYFT